MIDFHIYVKGDRTNGMGHICRQIVLARTLISLGATVSFITEEGTAGYCKLYDEGFPINDGSIAKSAILDYENGPTRDMLLDARSTYSKVIVVGGVGFPIHDQSSIDELVDLQIYQSIAVNGISQASNVISGCEYLILDPAYLSAREAYNTFTKPEGTLVVMGGSDPHNMTETVCEKLIELNAPRPIRAVFGPAAHLTPLPDGVVASVAPPSLAVLLSQSKIAVTALGMTTYEAACVGVPTASVCWSEDHGLTADKLEGKRVTSNLGVWNDPDWNKFDSWLRYIRENSIMDSWGISSECGKALVDGLGANRVAERILEL